LTSLSAFVQQNLNQDHDRNREDFNTSEHIFSEYCNVHLLSDENNNYISAEIPGP